MIVYSDALARWLDPAGMERHSADANAPIGRVLESLAARNPGWRIERIAFPVQRDGVYFAYMRDSQGLERYATVDPGNSAILREGGIWAFPVTAAIFLHYQLLSGWLGLLVVGCTGGFVLALLGTGISYWWPRCGGILRSLRIQLRLPPRTVLRQTHRSIAIICGALACASAVTGISMVALLLPGSAASPSRAVSLAAPAWSSNIDRALLSVRAGYPKRGIRDIRIDDNNDVVVYLRDPARNPEATDTIEYSTGGDVLVRRHLVDRALGWEEAILAIHNGQSLASFGKGLALCSGLVLLALSLSGPVMWYQGLGARRKPAGRREDRGLDRLRSG